jgi:hypothetical protein
MTTLGGQPNRCEAWESTGYVTVNVAREAADPAPLE